MGLIIRSALEGDLKKLLEIQKKAFAVQAEKYDAWDIPPMVETITDVDLSKKNMTVLVAEINNEIVGSIRLLKEGDSAEVKRLSVSDNHQNKGIGRKLMNEIENHTGGIKRLWLFTGGQSEKNISLYKKLGYTVFKEEHFKDEFTLIHMEKLL